MTSPPNVAWARAFAVFDDAIAITDPGERERMVSAACQDDVSLGDAVRRLLAADAANSPLLDAPAAAHAADLVDDDELSIEPQPSASGRVVGPYRIVRELGRGGMGVVYLAERDDVPMRVALKLVRGGLAAPEHIERFLFERRVLARLEHPRIARLLDAGVSADGTPWFAMEYVEGEPIDEYCDSRRLTVTDRVALFERVCDVVQFAHGNLVVHRDLKPSNVLVADVPGGGLGEPKLLDFGIAKLLDDGAESLTGTATRLMTPDYAAPEQVRGTPVTTVTDVYSLGVVLYELLTGRAPYSLRSGSFADIARAVLDTTPPRPSTVEFSPEAAAARGSTPERLRRQLAGDLDTIIGKALEKDPVLRYASAEAFLRDLRRHREGRAVSARPATMGYRVRTFVRRHRVLVASVVGVVVMLAVFAGSMTYQQAQTARALRLAKAETEKSRAVTGFLVGMFRDADPFQPSSGGGSDSPLDAATRRIDGELAGQPEVRIELLNALGGIRRNLGSYRQADELLRRAIDERRGIIGSTDVPDSTLAALYHELGLTLRMQASYDSSEAWLERALAMRRARLPADSRDIAATLSELAVTRRYLGKTADSRRRFEEVARIQESHGESIDLAMTFDRLSVVAQVEGDQSAAEAYVRRSMAIRERLLGPDHPLVGQSLGRLAWVLHDYDLSRAERAARQALDIQRRRLGSGHPATLSTEAELSLIIKDRGDLPTAERLQREVLAGRRKVLGEVHQDVAGALRNLGAMAQSRRDLVGADTLLSQALAIFRKVASADESFGTLVLEVATVKRMRGDERGAMALAREVASFPTETFRSWHTGHADALVDAAALLALKGDCATARTLLDRADSVYSRVAAGTSVVRPPPKRPAARCKSAE